jgi:hypothetical protein
MSASSHLDHLTDPDFALLADVAALALTRAWRLEAARGLFLAELLTSYTRVASGAVWVRQRRRWRRRRLSDLDLGQLAQMLEVVPAERAELWDGERGNLSSLERLGARCYRQACATATSRAATLAVVHEVADEFSRARRVLNFITDRHLFATREHWFSPPF